MNRKYFALAKKDLVLGKKKLIGFAAIMAAFAAIAVLIKLSMRYGNLAPLYEKLSADKFFLGLINVASIAIFVAMLFFFVISIQNIFTLSFLDDLKCKWDRFSITLPYSAKTVVGTKTAAVVLTTLVIIPLGGALGMLLCNVSDPAFYFEVLFLICAMIIVFSMITMVLTMVMKNYNMAGFVSMIPMLVIYIPVFIKLNKIREESTLILSQIRPDIDIEDELVILNQQFWEIYADKLKAATMGLVEGWWWAIILGVIAVTAITYFIMVKQLERRV